MKAGQWFRVENKADDPTVAEIYVIDFIGDWIDDYFGIGVTARAFVEALSSLPASVKTIQLHINSPGGDVFAGVNIANALRDQRVSKGRTVNVFVDGLAASIASVICMAGDTITMADNALMMIHQPWTIGVGDADDLRALAESMDKVSDTIVATYKWHSTLSDKEIAKLMDAETWFDADEAIAAGLATTKVEGLKAAASLDRRGVAKLTIPDKYRARVDALLKPSPEPPAAASALDVLTACEEAGCPELAKGLIAASATIDVVTSKVTETKAAKVAAAARATDIRAVCAKAKLLELADGYISGAMPLDAIRAHLTTLTARLDAIEIDGTLLPDSKKAQTVDVFGSYAALAVKGRPS